MESVTRRGLWIPIALGVLSGCASDQSSAKYSSGMNRVKVTQQRGESPRREETPILVSAKSTEEPGAIRHDPDARTDQEHSILTNQESHLVDPDESRLADLELGFGKSRLWTTLESRFTTGSSGIAWRARPALRGTGPELVWAFAPGTANQLCVRFGFWTGDHVTQDFRDTWFYAREMTELKMLSANVELKHHFNQGFYGLLGYGGAIYYARTALQTNVPEFQYEGFEGARFLHLLGVGLGLETPWRFPLRLFINTRWWLVLPYEIPALESFLGQATTGILWRFY